MKLSEDDIKIGDLLVVHSYLPFPLETERSETGDTIVSRSRTHQGHGYPGATLYLVEHIELPFIIVRQGIVGISDETSFTHPIDTRYTKFQRVTREFAEISGLKFDRLLPHFERLSEESNP